MKIYCLTCKEHSLNTSKDFVCGGPYHGGMFAPATIDKHSATMFDAREHTKNGDLSCPRCLSRFLGASGELMTEHGLINHDQKTVDESVSMVHEDGEFKGLLMHIKPSIELKISNNEAIHEIVDEGDTIKPDRRTVALKLREEGLSYAKIAKEMGVCTETARRIITGKSNA